MGKTIEAVQRGRYDWRALAGVLLLALPEVITWLLEGEDAPTLPPAVRWSLRVVGIALAAQGRPLLVREDR